MTRTAECCCGDCSITVEGEPVLNALCHCSSCKTRTGSAFGWSAYFPDEKIIAKSGDFRIYAKAGEEGYNRFLCARCGTTLYWKSLAFMLGHTGIAGGCFVADPLPEPNISASEASRIAWVNVPPEWSHLG